MQHQLSHLYCITTLFPSLVRSISNCVPENVTIVVEFHVYLEQLVVFRDGGSHVPTVTRIVHAGLSMSIT